MTALSCFVREELEKRGIERRMRIFVFRQDSPWKGSAQLRRYSTNQEIPDDGVYHVHHEEHRLIRSVVLLKGDKFPRCARCSQPATFELIFGVSPHEPKKHIRVSELPLAGDAAETATDP